MRTSFIKPTCQKVVLVFNRIKHSAEAI